MLFCYYNPIDIRRRFNVYKTSIRGRQRRIDVLQTLKRRRMSTGKFDYVFTSEDFVFRKCKVTSNLDPLFIFVTNEVVFRACHNLLWDFSQTLTRSCFVEKLFRKVPKDPQENTISEVFLSKVADLGLELFLN